MNDQYIMAAGIESLDFLHSNHWQAYVDGFEDFTVVAQRSSFDCSQNLVFLDFLADSKNVFAQKAWSVFSRESYFAVLIDLQDAEGNVVSQVDIKHCNLLTVMPVEGSYLESQCLNLRMHIRYQSASFDFFGIPHCGHKPAPDWLLKQTAKALEESK